MDKQGKRPDFTWIIEEPAVGDVLRSLNMGVDDLDDSGSSIVDEFERRLPDFIKVTVILALLPVIRRRSRAYFIAKCQLPKDSADELASVVVLKVFEAVCGRWPRGNVGAWIATIKKHVGDDDRKKTFREREVLGWRVDVMDLDARANSSRGDELARLLLDLSESTRDVFERRRNGDDWAIIEAEMDVNEAKAREAVRQEMDWPDAGPSRSRKKERSKRSS